MKIFHYINFTLLFLLIVAICVVEEVYVSKSLTVVQQDCIQIEDSIGGKDSIQDMEVVMLVDNLEYNWDYYEDKLCYLVNHKSIQEIGQEISKMKAYINTGDIDAFKVSLEQIKYYCHSYMHFMGANLHNVL